MQGTAQLPEMRLGGREGRKGGSSPNPIGLACISNAFQEEMCTPAEFYHARLLSGSFYTERASIYTTAASIIARYNRYRYIDIYNVCLAH